MNCVLDGVPDRIPARPDPIHERSAISSIVTDTFLTRKAKEVSSMTRTLLIEGGAEKQSLHTSLPSPRKGANFWFCQDEFDWLAPPL
jgi:hypothetical protein